MTDADMRRLLARKRDGEALPESAWAQIIAGVMDNTLAQTQVAALLMAVTLRGIDEEETIALTRAMIASGRTLSYPKYAVLDKHSSGGVGDTTSLLVVPWAAAAGMRVAKLAGRALGHTGGTIDKLESVPGLRTDLRAAEFQTQVGQIGCAIAAQSATLVPADKVLYALRDFTATVPSVGLIAASIVSKKIAAGAQHILYDVKVGAGAFMPDLAAARELALRIIAVTHAFGRHARVLISDMNEPLGRCIGDGLEMQEALSILAGTRSPSERLPRLAAYFVTVLAELAGVSDRSSPLADPITFLQGGAPLKKMSELLQAQGGDIAAFHSCRRAAPEYVLRAQADGYITRIDPVRLGEAARTLRDTHGAFAGFELHVEVGSACAAGDPILTVYGNATFDLSVLGIELGRSRPMPRPLVYLDLADTGEERAEPLE